MLYFIIVAALLNIISALFFVIVMEMEAAGTAIATVISQFGAFAAAIYHMYKSKEQFGLEFSRNFFKLKKEPALIIIKLGVPQLVRTTLVHMSMVWVNSNVNAYGLIASATNSVGNKIQKFLNAFMNGVDTASAAMIAQNLGAQRHSRAKGTLLYTLGTCLIISSVSSTLALTVPKELFGIFTDDPQVIEFGVVYMRIMVMTFFMSAITGSLQTMVTGSGFVSLGYLLGILDGMVCRVGFSLLFLHVFDYGVVSFFWGTAFSRTIPGVICLVYFLSGKWRTRKLVFE
jgi:Na+-driven multidrug efflux pump